MKHLILAGLMMGFLVIPLSARNRQPAPSVPIVNYVVQDTNRWEIYQDNRGLFTRPLPGSKPGGFWPKYSGRNYIFGAGIWIGAMDTTDQDTVLARGYDMASGGSSFGPCLPNGDTAGAMIDSLARTYRSDIPRDTAQWPERDSLGRAIIKSDQEVWAICSGIWGAQGWPSTVGVTCLRRSLAWNSPGPWGDITEMEFEVKNVTGLYQPPARTLRKVIFALGVDADIGNESGIGANDLCMDTTSGGTVYPNLAVQYQLQQEPGWSIPPPYFVGFQFISGPVNNTNDTLRIRSQPTIGYPEYDHDILPGEPLGVTATQIFTIDVDPSTPWACYLELAGYYYNTPTVYNAYQKDTFGPADKRFVMACGPFDLPNDSTVKFVYRIIGTSDLSDLIYKAGLVGVESPPQKVPDPVTQLVLYPPSPNPSPGPCLVRYALPGPSQVSLKIYDILGRQVRKLEKGEELAGVHAISWDGRDGSGKPVPGGVYLYRLEASGRSLVGKALILR